MSDASEDTPHCLNCGALLAGQYCGQCGQRASNRLISLWELMRDAFGDLFELDSRLWRTLIPLLARPGLLTRDYLEGRRARYMPPFRMYLVLSLIFFVVAFFDPREEFALLYEPGDAPATEADSAERESSRQEARAVLEELAREGIIDESVLTESGLSAADDAAGDEPSRDVPDEQATPPGFNITLDDESPDCDIGETNTDNLPPFLARRLSKERLDQVCDRVVTVGARGVIAALLDKIPAALLVLLPVMALVLKLLYPLSRRYYVEHLLFFVHFSAFLFLLVTLQILWSRLIALTGLPGFVSVLPIVATSFYVPVYLYRGMRYVYGQGHLLTSAKFLTVSVTFVVGASLMLLAALLLAVFSI